jgi:hypothetical protein
LRVDAEAFEAGGAVGFGLRVKRHALQRSGTVVACKAFRVEAGLQTARD